MLELLKGEVRMNESLARHTFYRIGGPAKILAIPKTKEDLSVLADFLKFQPMECFVLGLGSNLLVSDAGFDGLVIKTSQLNNVINEITLPQDEHHDSLEITVGASVPIATLMRRAASAGWDGLEFLAGVPGSIGGAVFMNAGTHLGETKDRLQEVESFQLEKGIWNVWKSEAFRYRYRKNEFLAQNELVYDTKWSVTRSSPELVKPKIDEVLRRRKATQPVDFPSCGSVFKNPEGPLRAWEVVEKLGLRGKKIGEAQISELHPNWIINLGSAKASHVKELIDLVKTLASRQLGIKMEEEVRFLGKF